MIKNYNSFLESKKEKFPDIKKYNIDGFTILLGRDAKSNDYLTFNIAEGEDLWMHVKGVPGSHVVIKVNDNLPTDEIIRYAADIAKKNSKASKSDSCKVVFCKRKFVSKDSTMNPGQVKVDYINSEEIVL